MLLLLAGCSTATSWVRTDGAAVPHTALQSEFAQCKAEAAQAGARAVAPRTNITIERSEASSGGFAGGFADGFAAASRNSSSDMNYGVYDATLEGCMARRGYLKERK